MIKNYLIGILITLTVFKISHATENNDLTYNLVPSRKGITVNKEKNIYIFNKDTENNENIESIYLRIHSGKNRNIIFKNNDKIEYSFIFTEHSIKQIDFIIKSDNKILLSNEHVLSKNNLSVKGTHIFNSDVDTSLWIKILYPVFPVNFEFEIKSQI